MTTELRAALAKLPPGPYHVVWPAEQGGSYTLWGRQGTPPDFVDGWAIPLVAAGVDTAIFAGRTSQRAPRVRHMTKRFGKDTRRLEVTWSDSQLLGGSWEPIRDLLRRRKAVRCHSVGFVLADDKRGVVLASSVNGRNAAGVTVIPASQIVKRRRLR